MRLCPVFADPVTYCNTLATFLAKYLLRQHKYYKHRTATHIASTHHVTILYTQHILHIASQHKHITHIAATQIASSQHIAHNTLHQHITHIALAKYTHCITIVHTLHQHSILYILHHNIAYYTYCVIQHITLQRLLWHNLMITHTLPHKFSFYSSSKLHLAWLTTSIQGQWVGNNYIVTLASCDSK